MIQVKQVTFQPVIHCLGIPQNLCQNPFPILRVAGDSGKSRCASEAVMLQAGFIIDLNKGSGMQTLSPSLFAAIPSQSSGLKSHAAGEPLPREQ